MMSIKNLGPVSPKVLFGAVTDSEFESDGGPGAIESKPYRQVPLASRAVVWQRTRAGQSCLDRWR